MAFAGAGYYWWQATVYMQSVLAEKEAELRIKRALIQKRDEVLLEHAIHGPPESPPTFPAA